MQVISQRCCGIDLHKKMIVACLLICTAHGVQKEIQTFSTMLPDLFRLRDWLKARQCQAVAMESTGRKRLKPPSAGRFDAWSNRVSR